MISNSKKFASALALFLIVALTAVYWNHFDNGFHFDDAHTIVNNSYIQDIGNIPLIFQDAKTTSSLPLNQAYRPMVTSLNTIDYWLGGGLNSKAFHWHIFIEFLVLLFLFYLLVLKVFEMASGNKHHILAVLAAGFFAFHTATAETINYIIARSDGFSTLMVLLSAVIYVNTKGWKKELGLLPFIIGCLAKPTTLMLAPILFLYDALLEKPSILVKSENPSFFKKVLDSFKHSVPYFVIGAAMYFFTRSMFSDTWKPSDVKMLDYLNTQPYIYWVYIKTFFVPTDLTADTDLELIKEYLSPKVLWGILVISVSIGLAFLASRKRKTTPIAFGILWFFVALFPSSSVVPLAEVMNHHRTFFPYLGLVIALVWSIHLLVEKAADGKLTSKWKVGIGAAVSLIFTAHAYGTYQRNEVWDNDKSLWYDVTVKSPNNGRGLMNYGLTEMREGNMEVAISYFERALSTNYGRHPYLFVNLAIAKNALAVRANNAVLKKEAEDFFKLALRNGPGYPDCHYHYAKWLSQNNQIDKANYHLNTALELSPAHQQAAKLKSLLTSSVAHQLENAKVKAEQEETPENYLELSLKYYNAGQYQLCISTCEKALALRPNYAEAYNNICSAHNKLKQFEKAEAACRKALEFKPGYPLAQGNLNWAIQQQKANQ